MVEQADDESDDRGHMSKQVPADESKEREPLPMQEDEYLLDHLGIGGKAVRECTLAWPENPSPSDVYRVHMRAGDPVGTGFVAVVVRFKASGEAFDRWSPEAGTVVEKTAVAEASHDGVRELRFNFSHKDCEAVGQLRYPRMDVLVPALSALLELEKTYCSSRQGGQG